MKFQLVLKRSSRMEETATSRLTRVSLGHVPNYAKVASASVEKSWKIASMISIALRGVSNTFYTRVSFDIEVESAGYRCVCARISAINAIHARHCSSTSRIALRPFTLWRVSRRVLLGCVDHSRDDYSTGNVRIQRSIPAINDSHVPLRFSSSVHRDVDDRLRCFVLDPAGYQSFGLTTTAGIKLSISDQLGRYPKNKRYRGMKVADKIPR